ncbi:hypothetical protein M406DRAFT_252515 [Cryphonectria parasitica EP155]|uniref:DNA damage-binding protein 1 n=1 Tax=Cryphonectria parasitica (strain ATCC 38755 / EP155) TaxID=660469 RepID=A0A9P4Y7K8_CRYP1|nr:uncharacterized protein M406DRAFT_252515 [Cryphonectria parasitica EP155]KAF3767909.1 hypothetical protein M406DRAFT_252515 [Cryphonectria parasitica EP155]
MAYIAPIHRPSSIRHAIQIRLFGEDEESLVVAKANRLEIYGLTETHQLVLRHSKVINGTISIIQRLRPKDSSTELLFVGTDRSQYFTLVWDEEKRKLKTAQSFEDAAEKYMRDSQSQDRAIVDPTGRFMAMHLWEGVLSVLRLLPRKNKANELEWTDSVRLSELFVKSSTFLYSETGHPKIALLYQSRSDLTDSKLATYRLTSDDKDTQASRFDPHKDREISLDIADPGAALLIPVRKVENEKRHNFRAADDRAFLGGIIVVGETRFTYVDDTTHAVVEAPLKEASIFVAWAEYDERRYFLADDYGRMYLLTIHTDGVVVQSMETTYLGKTSRASCLVYRNGMLFVGSHYGDSQLWKVDLGDDPTQSLQLTQVLHNVAPVLDFTVMDMGNREGDSQLGNTYSSGQARLVTGSGVHKDGSLRSVRSGVGLEDIGILADLQDVRGLFSLKPHGSAKADTLAVSFLTETRVFSFDTAGEVEEVEAFEGMSFEHQTLLAVDLPNSRRLQVTTAAAILMDTENHMVVTIWSPPGEVITAASANSKWVILSVDGKSLVSLDIARDLAVSASKDFENKDQVACVHASPHLLDAGVIGFFTSGNISIVDLATLDPRKGETMRKTDDNSSIPRDLALIQTLPQGVGGPTLFISMEDGIVATFNVAPDFSLSGRKSVRLGTQQARFHLLPRPDGLTNIFATTENPSLIYGSEGRIVYSAVTAEDATYVCDFDTEAYPGSVVVATETAIKISRIDTERRTHVTPLEMGETVRRIAYSPTEQVFGLGCVKRELSHGEEIITSSFKLVDEVIFSKVGKPFQLEQSSSPELVECVIRATLSNSYGKPAERFLVGTSFMAEEDTASRADETKGRLLVFGVDSDRNPYLLVSHKFKGSCRCLAVLENDIVVVSLTKSVVVGKYRETSSTSGSFDRLAAHRPATFPVDLAVEGNIIAIGDLMKSISLVEYFPATEEKAAALMEVARHYQSAWATAVCHIEDDSWLEADAQGNLMVLRRNRDGPTLEDQRRMEMTSEMNLGEMVNRIRKIAVETNPNAMIIPKAFIGTVEGAIYLFGTVASHAQDLLLRFQSKMAEAVQTAGELKFEKYRAFKNAEREAEGPFRFLDGELLERFLDMDEETQKVICRGLGPSVEDMRNYIEELKRMH